MRQIGILPSEQEAVRLASYLYTLGIRSQIEREPDGVAIWAIDEDRIPLAREEFARFVQNPADERYSAAEATAQRLLRENEQLDQQRRGNHVSMKQRFHQSNFRGLTFVLIVICSAIGIATDFGHPRKQNSPLYQNLLMDREIQIDGKIYFYKPFDPHWAVFHGQIWRLFTPILLHGSGPHLFMNMLGLHALGRLVENRWGSWRFFWLVLVLALCSNLVQYALNGPSFVGISGVVFGLFGYAWIKGKFDPSAGYQLSQQYVSGMIFWMILFCTGLFGPIANGAHIGGFVTGALIAGASLYWPQRGRQ
jgi:GlpG protein